MDHLEEEHSHQSPANGSSASDDDDFFSSMKTTHGQESVKQLEGYLASKVDNKEILQSYPAVCKLSLKIYTALPASAACERLFSTAGLIFSPRRARLDARNIENQLLLKLNKIYFSFRKVIQLTVLFLLFFCYSTSLLVSSSTYYVSLQGNLVVC